MSLSDFSISKHRDADFFEHVFPLKRDVPHVVSNVVPECVNLPASSSSVKDLVTEPRRSKRQRTKTSFDPNFVTSFLVGLLESFDTNALIVEFVFFFSYLRKILKPTKRL